MLDSRYRVKYCTVEVYATRRVAAYTHQQTNWPVSTLEPLGSTALYRYRARTHTAPRALLVVLALLTLA